LQARRIHNPLAAFLCLKERDVAGEINLVSRFATSSESIGTAMREPVPAAQYVRMSTEHQRYSTEKQSDSIQDGHEVLDFRNQTIRRVC
jgi:hypothetical protein